MPINKVNNIIIVVDNSIHKNMFYCIENLDSARFCDIIETKKNTIVVMADYITQNEVKNFLNDLDSINASYDFFDGDYDIDSYYKNK